MCLRSIHSTLPIIINNNSIDKLALTILHSISSNNKQSTMGKGYKLTSATGDGPKQCAFFFSDQGCRNGANCKFSHEANAAAVSPAANKARAMSVSSSSVCSSESEGEIVEEKRAGASEGVDHKVAGVRGMANESFGELVGLLPGGSLGAVELLRPLLGVFEPVVLVMPSAVMPSRSRLLFVASASAPTTR